MKNLYDYPRDELEKYFLSINEKKFKAVQVFEWLYEKRNNDVNSWSNIKKDVRDRILQDFSFEMIEIIKVEKDDLTRKYLFKLYDNEKIEAVLMKHDYGTSICVSSQVGCNMGCAFCESGRLKK